MYFCPHHPEKALPAYRTDCGCRKPEPGMFLKARDKYGIDMAASVSLGDKPRDVEAGERAGVGRNLLFNGDYSEISL